MTTDNCINVSWEVAKFLLPAAAKGDEEAMMLLCKLAVPSWSDVTSKDFKMEALGGGFSGNVPIKCSAPGVEGAPTLAVKINAADDDEENEDGNKDSLVTAAYRRWSAAGIVPTVFCLGRPEAPGLEVYEFIEGSQASWLVVKHGPEFMENDLDAASFGKIYAELHGQDSEWYEEYKDCLKGQWEDWQKGMDTNEYATEVRAKYGCVASMIVLFGDNHAHMGKNAAGAAKAAKELSPLLHEYLPKNSLLGRTVVGHGDAHGANIMHRRDGGHGDLVVIDLDFVGRMPAAYDLGTPLAGTTVGPYAFLFNKGDKLGKYPSLAQRRIVAQAYLDELGAEAQKFSRNEIEEVVLDMEVGVALRLLWVGTVVIPLGFNNSPLYMGWCFVFYARAALNLFDAAETDEVLRDRILEEGVISIITSALLEKGLTPLDMSREEYRAHWDLFGSLGPAFTGPFVPDDAPPSAEDLLMEQTAGAAKHYSSFESAALKFYESTGADVATVFDRFDSDKNGYIDLQELMACAVVCGTGFTTMADAEAALAKVDSDGDGKISLTEFKSFLTGARAA